jgi:CxxC-x17-CxxC domain-containing protein
VADRTLTCRDCGRTFTYTEGEQAFYASRGFSEPTRCPDCRAAKKAARGGSDSYGDSYGNGGSRGYSSGGGYGNGGGYGDSYGGGRRERTMTTVICSNCGQETQVPFVPSGNRPVYCSDCYAQMGGGGRGRR